MYREEQSSKYKSQIAKAILSIIFMITTFLTGCGSGGGKFIFFHTLYDNYGKDSDELKELQKLGKARKLQIVPKLVDLNKPPGEIEEYLDKALKQSGITYAAFSPLVDVSLLKVTADNPGVLFISHRSFDRDISPNLLKILFTKADSFEKGGEICGILLEKKRLEEFQSPGEKMKAQLLIYNLAPENNRENMAFKKGFSKHHNIENFSMEKVKNVHDKNEIEKKIATALGKGTVILFPRLYMSNTYSLDAVLKKGGVLILEDWMTTEEKIENHILFTINTGFIQSIEEALKVETRKTEDGVEWTEQVLSIPSFIKWGKALEMTGDIAAIIEGEVTSKKPMLLEKTPDTH